MHAEIILVLRSRRQVFNIYWQLTFLDETDQLSVAGPFKFETSRQSTQYASLDLVLLSLSMHDGSQRRSSFDHDQEDILTNTPILQLVSLETGYKLKSQWYCLTTSQEAIQELAPPIWNSFVRHRLRRRKPLDDDHTETDESSARRPLHRARPASSFTMHRIEYAKASADRDRTVELQQIGQALDSPTGTGDPHDMTSVLQFAKASFETNDLLGGAVAKSLFDIHQENLMLSDVDGTTALLEELLSSADLKHPALSGENGTTATLTVVQLADFTQAVRRLVHDGSPSELYDAIVSDWIKSLAPDIPGEVRLAKDTLARQITAEVSLSSHIIRRRQIVEAVDENIVTSQADVASEASDKFQRHRQSDKERNHQTSLPDITVFGSRTSSRAPSVTTSASRSSSIDEPIGYNLSSYIVCTKPLPTSIPHPLRRVLRHWDVGTDPMDYDWRARSQRVTRQAEEEELGSQLTERERARLQRKAEKLIRRQEREAATSLSQQLASNQAPELILSASQPIPDRTVPTSSLEQIMPSAASQATVGRHSTRPVKKKKRKQGF